MLQSIMLQAARPSTTSTNLCVIVIFVHPIATVNHVLPAVISIEEIRRMVIHIIIWHGTLAAISIPIPIPITPITAAVAPRAAPTACCPAAHCCCFSCGADPPTPGFGGSGCILSGIVALAVQAVACRCCCPCKVCLPRHAAPGTAKA